VFSHSNISPNGAGAHYTPESIDLDNIGIGFPKLHPSGLVYGHLPDHLLHFRCHPVLRTGLPPVDLKKRQFPSLFIQLLKPVKTVPRVSENLTGSGDIPKFFG